MVYVGGGEANIRGNVAWGNGIYRSTDAGKTWQHQWKTRGQIGTMVVTRERRRRLRGGARLAVRTGARTEASIAPPTAAGTGRRCCTATPRPARPTWRSIRQIPRIVYQVWRPQRRPRTMTSGGPGSGLFRSADGGDTWTELKGHGPPAGPWGKVGVGVAPSDPKVVYALIEEPRTAACSTLETMAARTWGFANGHR